MYSRSQVKNKEFLFEETRTLVWAASRKVLRMKGAHIEFHV